MNTSITFSIFLMWMISGIERIKHNEKTPTSYFQCFDWISCVYIQKTCKYTNVAILNVNSKSTHLNNLYLNHI